MGSVSAYKKLIAKINQIKENKTGNIDEDKITDYKKKFTSALENDINTSLALTTLYDVLKDELLSNNTKLTLIESFDTVLGLNLLTDDTESNSIDNEFEKYIKDMIEKRLTAKKNKDYVTADQIRNELSQKGVTLKDTPNGTEYSVN